MMKYFVRGCDNPSGTSVEFRKGKWEGWNEDWKFQPDSICIDEDVLVDNIEFLNAIRIIFPKFSVWDAGYDMTKYDWAIIGRNIKHHRKRALKIYNEADQWAQKVFQEYTHFTLVGF